MEQIVGGGEPQSTATPFLTVGVPVYNGRSLLRQCLRSILDSQLPRDSYELVIADDASTEPETRQILAELEAELAAHPGFCRVLRTTTNSGGAARPRNRILDAARGDYVFFVDADDTIGELALTKITAALRRRPADWVALHQVPVNGRSAVCEVRRPEAEVRRAVALTTLTVHKVFRRAEIERQRLRFDEGLPSGQDLAFAFSFLLNASRFLMLGDYGFYYLTRHAENPDEPTHLSKRAASPDAVIEKAERILRSMLAALDACDLPEEERRSILVRVVLPRMLILERYLGAIADAGPVVGGAALRRLSGVLAGRPVGDLAPEGFKGLTPEHLAVVTAADWPALRRLLGRAPYQSRLTRYVRQARRAARRLTTNSSRRQLIREVERLHQAVEELRRDQRDLAARLADVGAAAPPDSAEPVRALAAAGERP